jgi:sec-independent protein translocase protein TatA
MKKENTIMFPRLGLPELLIVLTIVVLIFGVGRIGKIGGELGKGIRSFRDGIKDPEAEKKEEENKVEEKKEE